MTRNGAEYHTAYFISFFLILKSSVWEYASVAVFKV